jgi:hypothetical protein
MKWSALIARRANLSIIRSNVGGLPDFLNLLEYPFTVIALHGLQHLGDERVVPIAGNPRIDQAFHVGDCAPYILRIFGIAANLAETPPQGFQRDFRILKAPLQFIEPLHLRGDLHAFQYRSGL